jgi:hypothetical protein
MDYIIRYNYNTGDSFHTEENIEADLDTWHDVSIAEENLQRIKEHYEFYLASTDNWSYYNKDKQAQNKKIIDDAKTKEWYVNEYDWCLKLKHDNGKEYQIHAPWCGYFESLNSVEIVENNPKRKYKFK